MKEELQSKLVEILTGMQAAVGKASDFALEQLPDIAQSYVMYGRVMETTQWAFCVALLLMGCIGLYKALTASDWVVEYDDWAPSRICLCGSSIFAAFIGASGFFIEGAQAALVWFAPKVWLLKELAALAR